MLKKIAISFCAVIVAIFALAYWQIDRVNAVLTNVLNEKHITFSQLDFTFFPQVEIRLSDVKWQDQQVRSVFALKVYLQSEFWSLLALEKRVKTVRFEQMDVWYSGQHEPDLVGITGEIAGDFLIEPNQIQLANILLKMTFAKPILFNTQQLEIALQKGSIKQHSASDWQVIFDDVKINGEHFVLFTLKATQQPTMLSTVSELHYAHSQSQSQFDLQLFNKVNSTQRVRFVGKNIALAPWQKMLNLPYLLTGEADISGDLVLTDTKTEKGKVAIRMAEGHFNGLNLLDLVTKYLPIHYDEARFNREDLNTSFQHLQSSLSWNATKLNLDTLTFHIDKVRVSGQGAVNLKTMTCDVTLNLGLTSPQYQHFSLPIRFFDSCSSPQYKVEFNQNLRHQLKDLIKEKLR
ncbi:hypothetical protein [Pasteurella multocida]|uniref:hypothetical protein n=1 Tax=Pasteurella multocida TaxID=747 RepID=UPI000C174B7E|nr:hypothetical protein [Pasteurella multocida]